MNYLSTTTIGKLCGCTRVWAWKKARDGEIPFTRMNQEGKHYRYQDSPKLRAWCAAIKADRARARLPKAKAGIVGVASWHGLAMQFDLMRRQVGDTPLTKWNVDLIDAVLGKLSRIIQFAGELQFRRRELSRLKNR